MARGKIKLRRSAWLSLLLSAVFGGLSAWVILTTGLVAIGGGSFSQAPEIDYSSTAPADTDVSVDAAASDAAASARAELIDSPISASALRTLAFAEQQRGDQRGATALLAQGAALGWRDSPTQLWLVQAYWLSTDYDKAAERLDAALRTHPSSVYLYNVLDELARNAAFSKAIVARMRKACPWRSDYLMHVKGISPDDVATRITILRGLAGGVNPATRSEILPLINSMVQLGEVQPARNMWFQVQNVPIDSIYDAGFDHIASGDGAAFEWNARPVLGAAASLGDAPGGVGRALVARTDGSASGELLHQLVSITPGVHRLRVAGSVPREARSSFGWVVRCPATHQILLDTTGQDEGQHYQFDVPANCDSQIVELRVQRAPKAASASAYFTGIGIV